MRLKSIYLLFETIVLHKYIEHLKSFPVMKYRQYGSIIFFFKKRLDLGLQ